MGFVMEFPPKIKEKARRAAAFKCCLCHEKPCFHTHHLDPKKGNDFENAVPLCVECHDLYGNDSYKRKFVQQARDFWYEYVEKTYPARSKELELNQKIFEKLDELESKSISKEDMIKEIIPKITDVMSKSVHDLLVFVEKEDYNRVIQAMSSLLSSATYTSGQLYVISSIHDNANAHKPKELNKLIPAGSVWFKFNCPKCGNAITDPSISKGDICPHCKRIIE